MLKNFSDYYWKRYRRYFQHNRTAKLITATLFLTVLASIAIGVFFFFLEGFNYIKNINDQYFSSVIPLYLYEIFFLVVSLLIFISGLITGALTLFRRENNDWLMATPGFSHLPAIVFVKMFFVAVWPVVLIAWPALLAVNLSFGLGIGTWIILAIGVVLMVFFLTLFGLLLIALAALLLIGLQRSQLARLNLKNLLLALGIGIAGLVGFIWMKLGHLDPVVLFGAGLFQSPLSNPADLVAQFSVFPSHWLAFSLHLFQSGKLLEGWYYWLILLTADIWLLVLAVYLRPYFLPLWQKMQEGQSSNRRRFGKNERYIKMMHGPTTAIFSKEFLVMFRDFKNLSWLVFSVALWVVYAAVSASIDRYRIRYGISFSALPELIPSLQVIVAVYFVSAIVLRFALPSFSSERRTGWILASAPVDYRKLFLSKALFFSLILSKMGIILGFIGMRVLEFPLVEQLAAAVMFLVSTIFVTFLGLAVGAVFPNFETDEVQVISTSLPGLGFIAASLLYGLAGTMVFYLFLQSIYWPLMAFVVFSSLAGWLSYWFSVRSLEKIEFIKSY